MKVYELIQELCQYDADADVSFNVSAEFEYDTTVEIDKENEKDEQQVTVKVDFNEEVEFDEIKHHYYRMSSIPDEVIINLVY